MNWTLALHRLYGNTWKNCNQNQTSELIAKMTSCSVLIAIIGDGWLNFHRIVATLERRRKSSSQMFTWISLIKLCWLWLAECTIDFSCEKQGCWSFEIRHSYKSVDSVMDEYEVTNSPPGNYRILFVLRTSPTQFEITSQFIYNIVVQPQRTETLYRNPVECEE